MKVLYDTCTIGPFMMGFSNSESVESLTEICERQHIAAFLEVDKAQVSRYEGEVFKCLGEYLLYLPAFEVLTGPNPAYTFYTLKSIIHPENILAASANVFHTFSNNGDNVLLPAEKPVGASFLRGMFCFAAMGTKVTVYRDCYAKVIIAAGGNYYRLDEETPKNVKILPNLVGRVMLEDYLKTIVSLADMIRPVDAKIYIPISSSVTKAINTGDPNIDKTAMGSGDQRVALIRSDGVAVNASVTTDVRDYILSNPNYIGYRDMQGKFNVVGPDPFTAVKNGCKILPSVAGNCRLFTNDDISVQAEDFYIKGYFGTNTAGVPYTRAVPFEFISANKNKLKFYVEMDSNGIGTIRILCIESPQEITLKSLITEVTTLGNAVSGQYTSVGLAISPTTNGIIR